MKEEYLLTGELGQTNEPYAIAKIAGIKMCENYNRQYGTNFMSVMPTNLYGPNDNYDLETSHVLPALLRKFHLGKCLEDENWDAIRKDLNKNPINEIDGSAQEADILNILAKHGITIGEPKLTSDLHPLSSDSSSYKINIRGNPCNSWTVSLTLWGTGNPLREFLHVDDLADACVFLMKNHNIEHLSSDLCPPTSERRPLSSDLWNIGSGEEIAIKDLAIMMKDIVGFQGKIKFDNSKPDGTMRKLLDVRLINDKGWKFKTYLEDGIRLMYKCYINNDN
jgi:GDP-L-fucose synthase